VGHWHFCAVRADGHVLCLGRNRLRELGVGGAIESLTPVVLDGLSDAVQVASGAGATCALRANGRVACWGSRFHEALVDGAPWTVNGPVLVTFPDE
jgi:alpha-tubulin suppressor-like RCC1 family protein